MRGTPTMNEAPRALFISGRDGKRLRVATWDAAPEPAPRGVCVLLSGQTEFIEKYAEVIVELRRRGFAVATMDWRGQGASVRELPDRRKAHIERFSQYDEDLDVFMEQTVRPMLGGRPVIALAHSMGSHILLRRLHSRSGEFTTAVLVAPMIEVQTRGYPAWAARALCFIQFQCGHGNDWVFGMEKRDPLYMDFEDNLVTSDRARFARVKALIAEDPDIRLNGPTWGWLEAAYHSMAEVNAPGYAEAIKTPMMVVGAGRDRIVMTEAVRQYAKRIPNATYFEIHEAEHEILMENDIVRARFWKAFDEYVNRFVPAPEEE
jgi:lysophospholipase